MKKLFIVLFLIYIFIFNVKVNTENVVLNDQFYAIYELYTNTTTKNIMNYMNYPTEIIQLTPINKKEFINYNYKFDINSSIDKLEKEYIRLLKKYNYNTDISYIGFKGLDLYKVTLYTTQDRLIELINTKRFSTNDF